LCPYIDTILLRRQDMGLLAHGPEVAEEERPVHFLDVDGAVLEFFGKEDEGSVGEHHFLPFFAVGYLDHGAEVLHVMGVGGQEHQVFVAMVGVGRLGEHAGAHDVIESEVRPGALDVSYEITIAGDEITGQRINRRPRHFYIT